MIKTPTFDPFGGAAYILYVFEKNLRRSLALVPKLCVHYNEKSMALSRAIALRYDQRSVYGNNSTIFLPIYLFHPIPIRNLVA